MENQILNTVTESTQVTAKVAKNQFEIKKYLNPILKVFTPNKRSSNSTIWTIFIFWVISTLIIWITSESKLLPSPMELIDAGIRMFTHNDLFGNLLNSIILVTKSMFYAIVICYMLATFSTMDFFKPIATFLSKSRFLTTVGLSVVFAQLTADTSGQKTAMLVFGITVFLVTSFLAIIVDIRKEEYNYAKTLKMSNWRAYWEIVIIGKSDLFIDSIRQNFAIAWMMLPMVENYCRVEGGIGIILTDQNKYFHLDAVYAIQIMVLFIGIGIDWFIGYMKGLLRPDTLIAKHK